MAVKVYFLACVVAVAFFIQVSTSPSALRALQSTIDESMSVENNDLYPPPVCQDETDCDHFGTSMCHNSIEDKRWAKTCCRKYCNFCNKSIPWNPRDCQGVPPMFTKDLVQSDKIKAIPEVQTMDNVDILDPPPCIDQTDCDPYGPYVCTGSLADHKWSRKCCREYCGFCNKTVPTVPENCQSTPPSFKIVV